MAQYLHPTLEGATHEKITQLAERFALQLAKNRVIRNGQALDEELAFGFFLSNPFRALSDDYQTVSLGVHVPFFPMIGDYVLFSETLQAYYCLTNGWVYNRSEACGFNSLAQGRQYCRENPLLVADAHVQYLPHNHSKPVPKFLPSTKQ